MKCNNFFNRDAKIVAKEILGSILIRKIGNKELLSKIVEVEYYDDKEELIKRNNKLKNKVDLTKPGNIFIYPIFNYKMFNIVCKEYQVVFVRAVEPLNYQAETNGPGKLTKILKIDEKFNNTNICDSKEIKIKITKNNEEIYVSKKIGVKYEDYSRFYIKSKFVSKRYKEDKLLIVNN